MLSRKDLQEWCRITCAGYPNVEIQNLSSSFRDGLAFCAIIHKHRPHFIDFSSLSKDNVYHNNKLAFEVAEAKLGIPALLDPKDMLSTQEPDGLSVITYLIQLYSIFNWTSSRVFDPSSSQPLHLSSNVIKTPGETPDAHKPLKSSADLETSREGRCVNTVTQAGCSLCFTPVHLIQRHLVNGKIYHRRCLRCKVCHCTLLPGSYRPGSDAGSMTCAYHVTNIKVVPPTGKSQADFYSLSGLPVTSVPQYTQKVVCESPQTKVEDRGEESREGQDRGSSRVGPPPPQSSVEETTQGADENRGGQKSAASGSSCAQETNGRTGLVSTRSSDSPAFPVPAPRGKAAQKAKADPAAGVSGNHSAAGSAQMQVFDNISLKKSPKVKANHPWMNFVHPGPWTQLPPAPAPVPLPRSKPVSDPPRSWNEPKKKTLNPFEEEDEEVEDTSETADRAHSTGPVTADDTHRESHGQAGVIKHAEVSDGTKAGPGPDSSSPPKCILPRSLTVPDVTSEHAETGTSEQSCKENPFDRKAHMSKSQTFSSSRGPAPGHGFPLIKRKVRTDQDLCMNDLQNQMKELEKKLEYLEQQGVEQERILRARRKGKEEEKMLTEWFSLTLERLLISHKSSELVYLMKQQNLEDRQADVEYELRCLLNKPESEWSQEDRGREQQLMDELVSIIEQRNQIISGLDQDQQRDKDKDMLLEEKMKNRDFPKEGEKGLKKPKGKFKPAQVFKILNNKPESRKDSGRKKD
ncbi:MICAL-like protein 1 isoform X2 [Oryzias latipes]|uniref:MICAL like 1 n=1 Tax=Oryzias latipes TaxID=8090 RepID=H2MHZ9_ORYLA|nr:MICAL-like protein 1 isoform X2 [Oryzias latipes]